jgi:hypothetical protein
MKIGNRIRDERFGVGTVKQVNEKTLAVQWDKPQTYFNGCDGHCKEGHGYYVSRSTAKLYETPFDFEFTVKVYETELVARGYYSSEAETRTEPSSFELEVQELETVNGDDVMEIISDKAMQHVREALLEVL